MKHERQKFSVTVTGETIDNIFKSEWLSAMKNRIEELSSSFKSLGISSSELSKMMKAQVTIHAYTSEQLKRIAYKMHNISDITGLKFDMKIDETTAKRLLHKNTYDSVVSDIIADFGKYYTKARYNNKKKRFEYLEQKSYKDKYGRWKKSSGEWKPLYDLDKLKIKLDFGGNPFYIGVTKRLPKNPAWSFGIPGDVYPINPTATIFKPNVPLDLSLIHI